MSGIDWSEIFISSGSPVRSVNYGRIDDFVSTGEIKFQTVTYKPTGILAHYLAVENKLRESRKITFNPSDPEFLAIAKRNMHLRDFQRQIENYSNARRVRGGDWHGRLAIMAGLMYRSVGKSPICEQHRNGRIVDVAEVGFRTLIECGDTNGQPIPYHLDNGTDAVIVLPFQAIESPIKLHVFTRGSNWKGNVFERLHLAPDNNPSIQWLFK